MANQITDNRTLVVNCDSATPFDDLSGAASGTLDTEIFIQGTGSIGQYITTTRDGLLYDAGTAQNWQDNHFYLWVQCGIVGLLDTKVNGGLTIRFCGATVTDWFEFEVAGSDDWPPAVAGGWTQFVVDIEATPSATNGAPPATTAIRYVGISAITSATMPRMTDNIWLDEIRRLPAATPGIIVEGRNGGSTDWSFDDIITQLGAAVGTAKLGAGGAFQCNAPIQYGISDTSTHGFSDTNKVVLWEDQEFVAADFYGMSALGNSGGTTSVELGLKTGTGDDAAGAQGGSITAASTGARYFMDFDDPDLDTVNFYGVGFNHGAAFSIGDAAVEAISCIYNDCSSALVTGSVQLRNTIVDANTADGVAFMTTDDIGDVRFCTFQFSDGHGVELTTPRTAAQTSKGNAFTGYGSTGTNDAAIYNNSAGAVAISATSGASVSEHTYRDGTSASTTVAAAITITYSGISTGTEIRVYLDSTGAEEDGIEATIGATWDASLQSGVTYNVVAIGPHTAGVDGVGYVPIRLEGETYTGDQGVGLNQQIDRNWENQ